MCFFSSKPLKDVIEEKKSNNNTRALTAELVKNSKPITDTSGKVIGVKTSPTGKGYLSNEAGMNILRLKGNQMEMGFQHGYLLAEQIQRPRGNPPKNLFKYWSNYVDKEQIDAFAPGLGGIVKAITAPWSEEASIADRIPDDVFRSLAGLVAGYRKKIAELKAQGVKFADEELITLFDFVRGYIQPDICNILLNNTIGGGSIAGLVIRDDGMYWPDAPIGTLGCTSVGILGKKTRDKALLLGCDFDYDPLAGLWEKNLTLIHFDPEPEHEDEEKPQRFITVTTAGSHTGGLLGINESGIAFRVHNNFSGVTDKRFRWRLKKHGQPVLNFGDYILKHGKSIENDGDLQKLITGIKSGINCDGRVSDSPPSGWTFITAQHKDSEEGKIIIRETNYKKYNISKVPAKYLWAGWRKKNRFALLSNLPEIKEGEPVRSIWQTNYYTSPWFRRKDIFDRRTGQFDRLNRAFRAGEMIRDIYSGNDVTWQDITSILADNKNVFAGNKERLNVGTIASLTTVTSIVYSIKPVEGGNPDINIFIAGQSTQSKKKTPTSWWPFYRFNFNDLQDENRVKYLKSAQFSPVKSTDLYVSAMNKLYDAYTYYTFTPDDKKDYSKLLGMVEDVIRVFTLSGSGTKMDPFLHFLVGRVQCNILKQYLKKGEDVKVQEYIVLACDRFDKCLKSRYLYDPHLITLARVFYVRLAINSNSSAIKNKMWKIIEELKKNSIFFEDLDLTPEMKLAIKPFLKKLALNRGDKLEYIRDERLEHVVNEIIDGKKYKLKELEDALTFDGPEPLLYDYQPII